MLLYFKHVCETDDQGLRIMWLELRCRFYFWRLRVRARLNAGRAAPRFGNTATLAPLRYGRQRRVYRDFFKPLSGVSAVCVSSIRRPDHDSRPAVTSDILGAIGAVEDWIPKYRASGHATRAASWGNRFMVTLAMRGVPFEVHENSRSERMFDPMTEAYSKLGRDLGGRLGYCATFMRQRCDVRSRVPVQTTIPAVFRTPLPRATFRTGRFFENRYYLTLILKYDDFDDGLKEIESLGQQALLQFAEYDPEILEPSTSARI